MNRPVEAKFVFSQDQDSCGDTGDSFQTLIVDIEDAGRGNYLILKTDRWAISPEDLDAFVKRLKWCVSSCRSVFDDEEDEKKEQPTETPATSPGTQSPPAITWEAFTARVEELKQLKTGWLDGEGKPIPSDGLDWLSHQFRGHYPVDLPLPRLFPTVGGHVLAEWGRVDNCPWSVSFEIDLGTKLAKYNRTNIYTNDSFDVNLDAKPVHSFWEWIAAQIRTYVGKATQT